MQGTILQYIRLRKCQKIQLLFYKMGTKPAARKPIGKNGGRTEKRTAYASCDIEWLDGHEHFKNLSCIGAIHRQFEKDSHTSSEWHYYISSKPLTAEELLIHARMEWGVEAMHWLLDAHFSEDKTRVWDMNLQKNLNIMRKTVLNLVKVFKTKKFPKSSLVGILRRNLFDFQVLSDFLAFFKSSGKLDSRESN
jgi:predicted transposase YbfD/YdcC